MQAMCFHQLDIQNVCAFVAPSYSRIPTKIPVVHNTGPELRRTILFLLFMICCCNLFNNFFNICLTDHFALNHLMEH